MEIRINAMSITIPEGFRALSAEERAGMQFLENGEGEVLQDSGRHIMISAAWKKHGRLANLLASPKDAIRAMEKKIAGALKAGGYECDGFLQEEVGGETAEAFRCRYTAQETAMSAESLIMVHNGIHYYVHCYWRTALEADSLAVIREMLKNVNWLS
ncbi:MAG: hypothetical protein IKF51_06310 [Solobacterium sp.]|nr:hypothetical protein [Solobacterium sp.]